MIFVVLDNFFTLSHYCYTRHIPITLYFCTRELIENNTVHEQNAGDDRTCRVSSLGKSGVGCRGRKKNTPHVCMKYRTIVLFILLYTYTRVCVHTSTELRKTRTYTRIITSIYSKPKRNEINLYDVQTRRSKSKKK